MEDTQFTIDSLRELNIKLVSDIAELRKENAEIPELRKKFAKVEAENVKLRQAIEENTKRDAKVEELEQKNIELETRLAILEQEKSISTKDILHSPVNSNDTPKQIVPQCDEPEIRDYTTDISISDITDNILNSNDTHEQIVSYNEESNISSHEVTASGNSNTQQKLETSTFPIPAETILLEEKEENEFLDSKYKEQVSKEIMERIREKKLWDQELLSTLETNTPDISHEQSLIQEKCQEISVTKNHEKSSDEISDMSSDKISEQNTELIDSPDKPLTNLIVEQEL
ncbi:4652_t:CDS:1 [Diversispora eburnea]|uniref:4652_t:CDS:1 n=1 Tax=Diversispora eburnea TaxID=1213867 RepID=A0A9N9CJI6_9GLOM|nr:4652_t:CDS:1 [Diversispora eburnea]